MLRSMPTVSICFLLFALSGAKWETRAEESPELSRLPARVPSPEGNRATPAKISLGKQLFFDPRLSGSNKMSCATCHLPNKAFADGLATAVGDGDKILTRNSQSVLNVAFFSRLFWDGRSTSLEEQALIPITSRDEMNQSLTDLEAELNGIPGYATQFRDVFGTGVTRDGISQAIAAFERTLVTGESPFDRFLDGDKTALSSVAQEGLTLFRGNAGCIRCHHGPLLSDAKFYRIGISFRDKGRGGATGSKQEEYRFRTPSLRNVAQTAPYMHDGSLKTLDDVVLFYFRGVPHSTPDRPLDVVPLTGQSFSDIPAIVAFLESLTGSVPAIEAPVLPD